jgi:hypothetical protein
VNEMECLWFLQSGEKSGSRTAEDLLLIRICIKNARNINEDRLKASCSGVARVERAQ